MRAALRSVALSATAIERVSKDGKATVVERLIRTRMRLVRATVAGTVGEEEFAGEPDDDEDV